MPLSHSFSIPIDCPYDAAYAYLSTPATYSDWAAVEPRSYKQLPNGDWEGQVRFGGIRHMRFTPPNALGILDHAVFRPGEEPLWMPMRVVPEGTRTELSFTFIQRPDMSDDAFQSTIEWITADLLVLKTVLESRFG